MGMAKKVKAKGQRITEVNLEREVTMFIISTENEKE